MHDHEDASNERGVAGGAGGGSRIRASANSVQVQLVASKTNQRGQDARSRGRE